MNKPPLGLTRRDVWLRQRTIECVDTLRRVADIENWEDYKRSVFEICGELMYSMTEWDKYYKND